MTSRPALLPEAPSYHKENRKRMTQPFFETVYVPDMHVAICHKHGDPDCSEVNHPLGKYLVGCYYPASTIIMDLSLPSERHFLKDVSNALKHGLRQSVETVEPVAVPLCDHGTVLLRDVDYLERVCENPLYYSGPNIFERFRGGFGIN